MASMRETGAADGIPFNTPPGARSPNTLAAHVLLYWASRSGGIDQNLLVEKLFEAHHVKGEDVGSPYVLAGIAGEVGMNSAEVLKGLQDHSDEDTVRQLIDQARSAGISGVPFFIINGETGLSGAQPSVAILQALDAISSRTEDATAH
jgi:predicted DsbA family dithiol-disulfide isomerase